MRHKSASPPSPNRRLKARRESVSPFRGGSIPWAVILEAAPLLSIVGAGVGLAYLVGYLGAFGVDVASVSGFADYLIAAFYGLGASLAIAAAAFVGWRITSHRMWFAVVLAGPLFVALVFMFREPLMAFAQTLPGGSLADPSTSEDPINPLLAPFVLLRRFGLPWLDPRMAVGAGIVLGGLLSGLVFASFRRAPIVGRRLGIVMAGLMMLAVAGSASYALGRNQASVATAAALYVQDGVVRYRLKPTASTLEQLDPECACGVSLLWAGEKGAVIACGDAVNVVANPENLTFTGSRWRHSRSPPVDTLGAQSVRDAMSYCRQRDLAGKLARDAAPSTTTPAVQDGPSGWAAVIPAKDQSAVLGLVCEGDLLVGVVARRSGLSDETERELHPAGTSDGLYGVRPGPGVRRPSSVLIEGSDPEFAWSSNPNIDITAVRELRTDETSFELSVLAGRVSFDEGFGSSCSLEPDGEPKRRGWQPLVPPTSATPTPRTGKPASARSQTPTARPAP